MYNKFFGFKEKPFKLVPNPEYLFLSKSHEEALAHLGYAISHGEGFVEIIGEVGTGKTTLCRVFLENLDESIVPAYVFNPKLDALQLLKVINDEFGIDSTPDNTKDLIDRLNGFLIEQKSKNRKVIVLIDEAQNLSLEVLEQLRLLSNLETTREKLLQIILVGQPELGEMLASHQLRQLGQRITINCQLTPLTFEETSDYIRHRIALASHRAGPPFDNGALKAIFEYSRGVPRLINIACDRALLNAFSRNSFKITGAIAREAISELNQSRVNTVTRPRQLASYIYAAAAALALAGALLYFNFNSNSRTSATTGSYTPSETAEIDNEEQPGQVMTPAASPLEVKDMPGQNPDGDPGEVDDFSGGRASQMVEDSSGDSDLPVTPAVLFAPGDTAASLAAQDAAAEAFEDFLKNLNSRHSRNTAILQAVKLWDPSAAISSETEIIEGDQVFFRRAAEENSLSVQPLATENDLKILQILNLPAILTFYLPNHAWPKYLTIAGLDAEYVFLDAGDQGGITVVDRKTLRRFWSGEAYVIWKNFWGLEGILSQNSKAESLQSLKMLLRDLSYEVDPGSSKYDAATIRVIKEIQRKNGLEIDGIVGPFTKIALYNESSKFSKPSLGRFKENQTENGS